MVPDTQILISFHISQIKKFVLFSNLDDSWAPTDTGRFNAFNPPKLYEILKSITEKDIEIYVAGHGGIST